jgi:hypothetical protein
LRQGLPFLWAAGTLFIIIFLRFSVFRKPCERFFLSARCCKRIGLLIITNIYSAFTISQLPLRESRGASGTKILLFSSIFHVFAGAVAGAVFRVPTLLALLGLLLLESVILVFDYGATAGLWTLANLVGLQVGYLLGIYGRSALEHAGYLRPPVRTQRMP